MGYIEGYIIPSPSENNFVIDTGNIDFLLDSIESIEIWDGEKYVPSIKEDIKFPKMSGRRARFKVTIVNMLWIIINVHKRSWKI